MRMPSAKQLRSLEKAVTKYAGSLSLATSYLQGRGIGEETARAWRLGVVASPEPGHETAVGRLCIPYVNRVGVIALKFRCMQDHNCKAEGCVKYTQPMGQEVYLFNVLAADGDGETIHITEGELDCVVLSEVLAEPVVGVPGVNNWKPHAHWHFKGWPRVLIWGDGDQAGTDFARHLRKEIANAEIVPMPSRHDVTSLYLEAGAEAIKQLVGTDEDGGDNDQV